MKQIARQFKTVKEKRAYRKGVNHGFYVATKAAKEKNGEHAPAKNGMDNLEVGLILLELGFKLLKEKQA